MPKTSETLLEIDLGALEHNYHYLRSRLEPKTKFLAVVKAYAYGSEAGSIAKKLETLGVDYFAVAYVKEGIALRKAGITKPILVLHPQTIHFNKLIENAEAYGFTNSTEACFSSEEFIFNDDCNNGENFDQFVFFDEIHPTARVHSLVGNEMAEKVLKGHNKNQKIAGTKCSYRQEREIVY